MARLPLLVNPPASHGEPRVCPVLYDNGLGASALLSVPGAEFHFTDWETEAEKGKVFPEPQSSSLLGCGQQALFLPSSPLLVPSSES